MDCIVIYVLLTKVSLEEGFKGQFPLLIVTFISCGFILMYENLVVKNVIYSQKYC